MTLPKIVAGLPAALRMALFALLLALPVAAQNNQ